MTLIEDAPSSTIVTEPAVLASLVGAEAPTSQKDLLKDLQKIRRDDGIYDGVQMIPVRVKHELTLPTAAEPTNSSLNIDQLRSEIEAQNLPQDAVPTAAERMMLNPTHEATESAAELAEGFQAALSGARTLAELRDKARAYVATEADGLKGLIVETADGWFKPIPGSSEAAIFMSELERSRQQLDKRSAVEKASQRVGRAFDITRSTAGEVRQVVRDYEDKAQVERQKRAEKREERLEAAHAQIESRREAERDRELERQELELEAEDRLRTSQTFEDYVLEKQTEARRPFDEQIARLQRRKAALDDLKPGTFRSKERSDREIGAQIATLQKEAQKVAREARKLCMKERSEISKETNLHVDAVLDLLEAPQGGQHIYKPAAEHDPERTTAIAATISEVTGKIGEPPYQVDEYQLGDTRMQRLVFLTRKAGVYIVEDWDKTAGVLKRQSVLKGDRLLVREHENAGHGVIRRNLQRGGDRLVFSNEAYKGLGPFITTAEVEADAGTSYESGSYAFAGRLARSGVAAGNAYSLASGGYRAKKHNSPSFIKMISQGFEKALKTK